MRLFSRLFKNDDPTSRVTMINSVDNYVAGETYDLPVTVADTFIARGYCKGSMSRMYTNAELTAMHANHQVVGI